MYQNRTKNKFFHDIFELYLLRFRLTPDLAFNKLLAFSFFDAMPPSSINAGSVASGKLWVNRCK